MNLLPCLLLLYSLATLAFSQNATELAAISEAHEFKLDGKTLPYRLFKPTNYDPKKSYPLYLALHGAGARDTDNFRTLKQDIWAINTLASKAVRERHPCFIVVPQCPPDESWVKLPWNHGSYDMAKVSASPYLSMLMPLVNEVCNEFNIDDKRLYVGGYSMGGYGTWDLITRNPEVFAAAIPVCGSGAPGSAETIKHIPIWIFHGDKDRVVPTKGSQEMYAALKAAGADVKYTEFKDTRHNAWEPTWQTEGLVDWLFGQSKK
jgi:predicted peptidase